MKYRKNITSELAITNQQLELSNLQLEKARQKAEEAVRTKSAFLANMSHEIRTPMNAIIGLSGLTLKTGLDTVQHDYLQKIEGAANSLLGIIDDVLDFSKIEADKLKLEQVAFSLDDVMKKLYDLFSLKTESKGLIFEIEVEPGIGRSFVGDPLRLGQILTNLVANAVKFTETGRILVRVVEDKTMALPGKDRVELRFEVIDSGIGIPTDRKEKLFQAFDQVDSSTTRKYGGTGLGLSISKKLVQMMGGTIWVTSEPGKGSCFCFTAGFTRLAEKQPAEGDQTDAKHSLESIESALRGTKVLLVEDNEVNQMVAKALLKSQGVEVTLAANGKIALDLLQEDSQFDAVLMDIQMPEMDGYTTTKQIRMNDRHKNLPIIAMTAHAMEQEKQKCLEVGMNDHIGKPILPDTLFATLVNWISLNKALDKR
ncbi:ATP-binding protein [Vibrio sp. JC009]|uniref:ATP-binding protein n=1 Tax=Vibrio sp. JC009 TaxID=2912314 RepID=UPI0023B0FFA6|nr:ATP-binding protein [Vibrio sp. JC009]WED24037.1 ATP-binding protein [Vibrio sp. JC009]